MGFNLGVYPDFAFCRGDYLAVLKGSFVRYVAQWGSINCGLSDDRGYADYWVVS